jgi:hypothetical protein
MRIAGDGRLTVTVAENTIGGFTANPGQGNQFVHRLGNLAPEPLQKFTTGPLDIFGLVAEKAGTADRFP